MTADVLFEPTELEQITQFAHQRGYETVNAYLRALVDADMNESSADGDDVDIRAGLARAWRDVLNGDVLTEEEFWKELSLRPRQRLKPYG
jgi:hypothetical protein